MNVKISENQEMDRETRNIARSAELAAEGMVLLKNDGVLPLNHGEKTIALYGRGARRTEFVGTGSGKVNFRKFVTVEDGLREAGFSIVTGPLLDEMDGFYDEAKKKYEDHISDLAEQGVQTALLTMLGNPFREPEYPAVTRETAEEHPADAAIYVLSRVAGEGADRRDEPGDFRLKDSEREEIALLAESYEKTILLLNVCGPVEISSIADLKGVNAILLMGLGGNGAGTAAAKILSGEKVPSGKLTSTWMKHYSDVPFADEYGPCTESTDDSYYKEGIFVGYRYADTFGVEPLYPFGFGLSYTTFTLSNVQVRLDGTNVQVDAAVTNTGSEYSGKEIVQVYVQVPSEELSQPKQMLAAFGKTNRLAPGESETLSLSFPVRRIASYRERTASWVLEQGDYIVCVGTSSRETRDSAILRLSESAELECCKNLSAEIPFSEMEHRNSPLSDSNLPVLSLDTALPEKVIHTYPEEKAPKDSWVRRLSTEEKAALVTGASRYSPKDFTAIGTASERIPGAAGDTTKELKKYGLPSLCMVDGPAGIRVTPVVYERNGEFFKNPAEDPIFRLILPKEKRHADLTGAVRHVRYFTAIPTALVLAQSWDTEVIEQAGSLVGEELEELNADVWLAPGLNIHRNPLCGRNYEYFSEDPVLSGICAASVVKGVQSHPGKTVSIKHFAANSQETNRNFNNSVVSERTLREIYLKGFEICVHEASPYTLMTSLNLINGVHAANNRELLKDVLRGEWDFNGMVMTDWGTTSEFTSSEGKKYGTSRSEGCISAGNDLIMPGSQHDVDHILEAIQNGLLSEEELTYCADNVFRVIQKLTKRGEPIHE
ncbi:MAG: glycoside hydrolase family 3 protein [Bariatricus sp.]